MTEYKIHALVCAAPLHSKDGSTDTCPSVQGKTRTNAKMTGAYSNRPTTTIAPSTYGTK